VVANPLAEPTWDQAVATLPGATFFHSRAWAQVLHATYGLLPTYLTRGPASAPSALLPLMEVESWWSGRRGVSLPFTDECQPLGQADADLAELRNGLASLAATRRWRTWELHGGAAWMPEAPDSVRFRGHSLALSSDPANLFGHCDEATRRAVRKAERGGVTVEFAHDEAAIREFHQLLCLTRRRHGLPPQPFRFFAEIQRHILARRQGFIALARHGGRVVAGAVFFHFGAGAVYKFGASAPEAGPLRANNLALWRGIERCCSLGLSQLDLGRTSLANEGLRRFKLGWGATERTIAYRRRDCRRHAFLTSTDRAHGWHTHVFRALPVPVSRALGEILYRHLA
jgi:hypothetical protein